MRAVRALAAFAGLSVAAASPASAQRIPDARDKETLRIFMEATVADSFCPGMRINLPQLHAYMESRGFGAETLESKYPEFYAESLGFMVDGMKTNRASSCQFYFDELGDAGTHPHILVHR